MKLETLDRWLTIWKELLDDPQELLLSNTFVNAARAVADEPNIHQKGPVGRNEPDSNWKRRIFGILEHSFDKDTITVDYLRAEHPTDIADLQRLLHEPSGFDVGEIIKRLNNIKYSPSTALLRREFHQELLRDTLDEERLTALLRLLLRNFVTKVNPEALAQLPKATLTKRATRLFLSKHVQALAGDEALNKQVGNVIRELLFKRAVTKRVSKLAKKNATSVFNIFSDGLWWNLSYRLVEDLTKPLAEELSKKVDSGTAEPPDLLLSDETALRGLGSHAVEDYIRAFLRWTLSEIGRKAVVKKGSRIKKLGMGLGDHLVSAAAFNHDRSLHRRPDTLDNLSAEAVFQAAAKTASVTTARQILSENDTPLAIAVGRLAVKTVAEAATGKVDWKSVTVTELQSVCTDALARKEFHKELGELLGELNAPIHEQLKSLASKGEKDSVDGALPDAAEFWREWVESSSIGTGTYKSVFNLLPWETLTDTEFSSLLDEVIDSVLQPQENWLVGFKVYEIAPQGAIWTMGNVTFYDPAVYDFGEGRWLGVASSETNEAITFAMVSVTADAWTEAATAARRNLNDALNILSFSCSAGVRAGGLKPEVHRNSFVINVSTRKWTGGWTLSAAEMPTEHGALSSELTSVAMDYDGLLGLAARRPGNLTELQEGFLRAIYWYRKGRWEPDITEKFSFYWIGLEHLVKRKAVELPYIISKLHITWRDVPGDRIMWRGLPTLRQLEDWREEAVEKIKGDPVLLANVVASADLQGWDSDPNLLLRPEKFDVLVPLVPTGSPDERFFTEYRDDIREVEGNRRLIESRAESMRISVWLRLRLLYRVRNQLFHEALTYRPDMEIYVAALETILEDTLKKMVGEVTAASPMCRTMDELVDWYQKPWM